MKKIIIGNLIIGIIALSACSPGNILNTDKVYDENYAGYKNSYNNNEAGTLYKEIIDDNKITAAELEDLCKLLIGKNKNEITEICGHPRNGKIYREPNPPKKTTYEETVKYWVKTDSAVMGYGLFYVYINMHKEVISVHQRR